MNDGVACDETPEISGIRCVVAQRVAEYVRHSSAGLVKNRFRCAGVPLVRARPDVELKVGLSFANHSNLESRAS